jgi:hypothetical protein
MNCTLLESLFIAMMLLVISGHAVGAWAWRDRFPHYSRWQWTTDPFYFLRSRYYQNPRAPARFIAAGLLSLGVLVALVLVAVMLAVQRAGAAGICGLQF